MEVESVIADSPSYCAFFTRGRSLVGLTFDTKVHNVVSANSTVINDDIPSPESNSAPLLDLESLLSVTITALGSGYSLGGAGIWHINIHDVLCIWCLFFLRDDGNRGEDMEDAGGLLWCFDGVVPEDKESWSDCSLSLVERLKSAAWRQTASTTPPPTQGSRIT